MPNLGDINKPLTNEVTVIIDGMNLFHRQYHAFKKYPYGTAFGFLNSLIKFSKDLRTNKFIICWEGKKNWRETEKEDYKGTRKEQRKHQYTDEEKAQFSKAISTTKLLLHNLGIVQILNDDCEADDIIAWFAMNLKSNVVIISNDKDFMQLVNDKKNIKVMRPVVKVIGSEYKLMGEKEVFENFGIEPKNIAKFLAIAGDTADNVKGVHGLGRVKAINLINSGMVVKEKLKEIFTAEQLAQFVESYRMVKLGNDKIHHITLKDSDLLLINSIHRLVSKPVYLSRVQEFLDSYQIKKYRATDTRHLFNYEFVEHVIEIVKKAVCDG